MSRDKHTPDEVDAAEALARALDGQGGSAELPSEVPADALEVAAFLRYSRDGGELSQERQSDILKELLADAPQPRAQLPRRVDWRRWLVPAGGFASAVAAAIIAVLLISPGLDLPVEATVLPPPGSGLLEAQLAASRPGQQRVDDLSLAMRDYRDDMYVALNQRYTGAER